MLERIHLEILTAIKEHGTLTSAAESLHLTQSALSHSIKKLEGQVATPIWKKDGRNLRLTTAGERIQTLASRILPQFLHTELLLNQIAKGEMGSLRIGMECHPCYQWLLRVIDPYLEQWPDIDIDVKQEFQFGALGALLSYEIDVLITPDPLFKPKIDYIPVFDYEHRLVVATSHKLSKQDFVLPEQLSEEVLFSYPVEPMRLDIFSQFLNPAKCSVKKHKIIETTEIMLQMVAAGRGICALPGWLVDEFSKSMPIKSIRIGEQGISKKIFLGIRKDEQKIDYLDDFIAQAKKTK
ncbi:LysR family transcriptional regulator [Thalassomonas actiniarum]|uniref:HTH-type transcriptional regulator MetR n=1 Tax=Thalassomonas actiniarum TaxID=485447 RepID=A0AAF0C443_9GAMM|nr:LysR family transcriptional regulator [Thalassomonas actiniarum]WDD99610.1 LysR family transcriptional regulator [Thalassomonas actiniarum]